jgi:hypothetical protein
MIQVAIYSFHEFAEAGLLPNSEVLHAATEKFSPDGLYGKWFSPLMIMICGLWLFVFMARRPGPGYAGFGDITPGRREITFKPSSPIHASEVYQLVPSEFP